MLVHPLWGCKLMYSFLLKVMSFCIPLCQIEERVNTNGLNAMWKVKVVLRQCMCAWSAAVSHSSRRFCSVTAVVCRQFSHMTRGEPSSLLPVSALFLGKMAAIALLLPVTHMNRCDQKNKHGKCGDALHFNDTDHSCSSICCTQKGQWVWLQRVSITYICCV